MLRRVVPLLLTEGSSALRHAEACSAAAASWNRVDQQLCSLWTGSSRTPLLQHPVPSAIAGQSCACHIITSPGPSGRSAVPMQPWGQVRGMFIQTQSTPNPQSLMFMPGRAVMDTGSKMFPNARAAMASPLATRLFQLDGVTSVLFGSDFITVTKKDDSVSWAVLKPDIFAAITDHFSSGEPLVLDEETLAKSDTAIHDDDSEVVAMVKELLETRIRPAVQEDGGDIQYRSFDPDTGVVVVKMMGSCSGCPSSTVTLKSGVENMLMHYVPEVTSVVAEEDEAELEGNKTLEALEAKLGEK